MCLCVFKIRLCTLDYLWKERWTLFTKLWSDFKKANKTDNRLVSWILSGILLNFIALWIRPNIYAYLEATLSYWCQLYCLVYLCMRILTVNYLVAYVVIKYYSRVTPFCAFPWSVSVREVSWVLILCSVWHRTPQEHYRQRQPHPCRQLPQHLASKCYLVFNYHTVEPSLRGIFSLFFLKQHFKN